MHLWKHPYVAMKFYLQRMTVYNETRDTQIRIPLCTTIRALGSTTHNLKIHLLLPDWETGHSDLKPLSKRHSLVENTDLSRLELKTEPLYGTKMEAKPLADSETRFFGDINW